MIKTFEQFVAAKYGKPVNEGFQSSKLRAIIKQHGLPKNDWDKKMLYDLQDNEIIDVVDNRKEYSAKYMSTPASKIDWSEEQTFIIELEDGVCVVIGNLGIDKSHLFLDYIKSADDQKREIFKERHAERHKGNLGKHGGDDIHKKHLEKVDELESKRLAAKLQPNIPEIVEKVKSIMDEIDPNDLDESGSIETEFTLDGEEYTIYVNYTTECSDIRRSHGVEGYDLYYQLESFEICDENACITNDTLGVTEDTHKDLFETYTEEDMEGRIYDYYEYYGVKRSDFY
jgi:hypothetical protein